jgi:hypothetical protein
MTDPRRGGNLELVVPLVGGGIAHYWRDNGSAHAHWRGPAVFARELGQVDAVVLTDSTQGAGPSLEVIVRKGGRLAQYWRAVGNRMTWHGPAFFFEEAAGIPGVIEGGDGAAGSLQILAPLVHGGMVHLYRGAGGDWQIGTCIDRGGESVDAVSLVAPQSHPLGRADLEAVTVSGADVTWHRRENGPFGTWTRVLL